MDHFFTGAEGTNQLPAVNVKEDDNGFAVAVAAPGFEKADFSVEIDQNTLTIAAEKETEEENQESGYVKREFRTQAFRRSFRLPENTVDSDKIEARYEAGILYLTLPKREEVKPKPARLINIA